MRDRADAVEHEQPRRAPSLWSRVSLQGRGINEATCGCRRVRSKAFSHRRPRSSRTDLSRLRRIRPAGVSARGIQRPSHRGERLRENSKPARDSVAGPPSISPAGSKRSISSNASAKPASSTASTACSPSPAPLAGMPDSAMTQLFRDPPNQPQERWLPAIEVFGEGIYIELREDRIRQWQQDNDAWLRERLERPVPVTRLQDVFQTLASARARQTAHGRHAIFSSTASRTC